MTNPIYPFADVSLARRLENTEAHGNVSFVEARARAFPDSDATWTEIAGTYAMFDGPGSPVSQTFGLGMFQPVTHDDLSQIEEFFSTRGTEVFHEVSPLADPTAFQLLNERGYQPIEFTSVLFSQSARTLSSPSHQTKKSKFE